MDIDRRRRRVERLKKEIIFFRRALLIIPWVLVVFLLVRAKRLSNDNKAQASLLNEYLEQMEMLTATDPQVQEMYTEYTEPQPVDTKPVIDVESLTPEEIEALSLSDEELYDGYRKVYLTFDDGPSSNTEAILDILKEYNVKATFFVIYKDGRDNEELYRRIVDEGHTIGMHSCTHVYSTVYGSPESFKEDTKRLRDFIYMVTGVESIVYRFPGGSSNRVSQIDMKVFAQILQDEGIAYFDWNVSSQDASSPILSKSQIVRNSTVNLQKYNEAVILFHDTASKVTTVEALPEIIEYIQGMEHTVILPITKETNPIQHVSVE